jgi:hypothetical protein
LLVKHYTKVPLFNHTTIANLSRNATRKMGLKERYRAQKTRPIHKELGEGYGILEQDYSPKCSVLF